MHPAIVIVAYNRPNSLERLLRSLTNARFPDNSIPLHISIDKSNNEEVAEIARRFEWRHGPKTVEVKVGKLGLKKHILECGRLTEKYGSIILLEDDLFVAPHFYQYALGALEFYTDESRIAGISLYNYEIAESCGYPFSPVSDGSDVYFAQVASSWGQAWTARQWKDFERWLGANEIARLDILPEYIQQWSDQSWKKLFIAYLIDQHKYFVFPRKAYTTNFEDSGTHAMAGDLFMVELELSESKAQFTLLDEALARYDAWFELEPQCLSKMVDIPYWEDLEIDLYAAKNLELSTKQYVLTSRIGKRPLSSYSSRLRPLIQNVLCELSGYEIGIYKREDVQVNSSFPEMFFSSTQAEFFQERLKKSISCSVVVPITQLDEEQLHRTLSSLHLTRANFECVLVCPCDIRENVQQFVVQNAFRACLVAHDTLNEDTLLFEGLKVARSECVSWCRPGSVYAPDIFEKLPSIFHVFGDVSFIRGISDPIAQESYQHVDLQPYRVKGFEQGEASAALPVCDMELMFWRKKLFNPAHFQEFNREKLWEDFLREYRLHVVAYNFGTSVAGEIEYAQICAARRGTRAGKPMGLLSRVRQFLGGDAWNLLERHRLPFVLRYDFVHQNFFRSPY